MVSVSGYRFKNRYLSPFLTGAFGPFSSSVHMQCPWHPNSKHLAWECINLQKSLNAPYLEKEKDKENEDDDKSDGRGFQYATNVVNVIFGGNSTKRGNKLMLCEILAVESATPQPLKHSEVPISFS